MATLQDQLTSLNDAISRGVRKVAYEGKTVEYNSLKEMMTARRDLEARLNTGKPRRARVRLAQPR
jgi:hypothetical protein